MFIKMILFIHLVLLLILIFKLHHLLRDFLNIPNIVTYLIGTIPFMLLIIKFKVLLISSEFKFLVISIFFLGLAVLIDLLTDGRIIILQDGDRIEEYFRIAGSIFWLIYNYLLYKRFKTTKNL